jgi:hypothetical protein
MFVFQIMTLVVETYTTSLIHLFSFNNGSTALCWFIVFSSVMFIYRDGKTPWTSALPSQGRHLHTGQHKQRINAHTDIHTLSGIRTHNPSVRVSEDTSCFRLSGQRDRQLYNYKTENMIKFCFRPCRSPSS